MERASSAAHAGGRDRHGSLDRVRGASPDSLRGLSLDRASISRAADTLEAHNGLTEPLAEAGVDDELCEHT